MCFKSVVIAAPKIGDLGKYLERIRKTKPFRDQ